ncbi:MAG: nucleotidyltransferase domain-containing protein [Deltaproteobacteria bacterium]|nr:nucleotidyltransferase domain-containing protein [Deltaproteobacteria bacterium]
MIDSETLATLHRVATATPRLEGLVLFGSRARGDAGMNSDWDFGFLGRECDSATLLGALVLALKTDRVDLVDLSTAGGVLRYRAAADGVVIFEARPGIFARFWFAAVSFWLDMGGLIHAEQARLIAETAK